MRNAIQQAERTTGNATSPADWAQEAARHSTTINFDNSIYPRMGQADRLGPGKHLVRINPDSPQHADGDELMDTLVHELLHTRLRCTRDDHNAAFQATIDEVLDYLRRNSQIYRDFVARYNETGDVKKAKDYALRHKKYNG